MTDRDTPRLVVTGCVFLLFAFVLWHNRQDDMLIGAMIGSFGTTVAFWLGSSKGSADKSDQLERMGEGPTGAQDDPLAVQGPKPGHKPVSVEDEPKGE